MHYKWNYSVIIVWYSVYWPFSFSHPKKSDEIEVPFSIFTEIAKALFPIFCSVSSQTKSSLELTREAGDIATAWVCFALLHSKVKWRPFSRVRLCDPHGLYCPRILQARITGVGSRFLLQGISQGSNPGLCHCRSILYQLSHQVTQWSVTLNWPLCLEDVR